MLLPVLPLLRLLLLLLLPLLIARVPYECSIGGSLSINLRRVVYWVKLVGTFRATKFVNPRVSHNICCWTKREREVVYSCLTSVLLVLTGTTVAVRWRLQYYRTAITHAVD